MLSFYRGLREIGEIIWVFNHLIYHISCFQTTPYDIIFPYLESDPWVPHLPVRKGLIVTLEPVQYTERLGVKE